MRSFEPFRLDVTNQCLWRGDTRVPLMPKPFAVLRYLVEHPGRLVTHDQLLGADLARYLRAAGGAAAIHPGDSASARRSRRSAADSCRRSPSAATSSLHLSLEDERDAGCAEPVSLRRTELVGRGAALADLDRCLTARARRPAAGRVRRRRARHRQDESGRRLSARAAPSIAGVVGRARGQSVEGFGGKEAYYPLLEAIGQLARGPHDRWSSRRSPHTLRPG